MAHTDSHGPLWRRVVGTAITLATACTLTLGASGTAQAQTDENGYGDMFHTTVPDYYQFCSWQHPFALAGWDSYYTGAYDRGDHVDCTYWVRTGSGWFFPWTLTYWWTDLCEWAVPGSHPVRSTVMSCLK